MNDAPVEDELSPRARRHQRTRQSILEAARTIIAESGVDKLSIRALADRIDYSPAGLYEYFGNKEEIVEAVCWEGHRTLREYVAQVPVDLDPAEYLVETGMAYIEFAQQNADYFVLMFSNILAQPELGGRDEEAIRAEMMDDGSSFPLLLAGVDRAVQRGVVALLPGQGLFETAYALWSLVHGAAMLRTTHLKELSFNFEATHRHMLAAFIRGLRP